MIEADKDVKYAIQCIMKGSDMVLESGIVDLKNLFEDKGIC